MGKFHLPGTSEGVLGLGMAHSSGSVTHPVDRTVRVATHCQNAVSVVGIVQRVLTALLKRLQGMESTLVRVRGTKNTRGVISNRYRT